MQSHAFVALGLTDSEWGKAIAQNLIASLIFAVATFLATRAAYRARLTDKDTEIEKARLGEQKALLKAETGKAELAALKQRFDDLSAASMDAAFASYEREERDGNFERAAGVLKEYFERERQNLARLTGTLGDWYAAFLGDEDAAGAVKRPRAFTASRSSPILAMSAGRGPQLSEHGREHCQAASARSVRCAGRLRRPFRLCHGKQPSGRS